MTLAGCGWPSVAAADPLPGLARNFAGTVQHVLNMTICCNIRITTLVQADRGLVLVGYGLGKSSLRTRRIPVSCKPGKPQCWLDVAYRLRMDSSAAYLTVDASSFGVYAADEDSMCLCHFDYERDKEGYPEAHLQVYGTSKALAAWSGTPQTRELERLHIPVGGRRFRPTIEDVIEFMITRG